jgi:hypothetical protein
MTSCGCTSALTRRGGSSASTNVFELQRPRLATWAASSRVNGGADWGWTRLGIGRPPPLRIFCRGFGSFVLPTTHTHDHSKPGVCGWSAAHQDPNGDQAQRGLRETERARRGERTSTTQRKSTNKTGATATTTHGDGTGQAEKNGKPQGHGQRSWGGAGADRYGTTTGGAASAQSGAMASGMRRRGDG